MSKEEGGSVKLLEKKRRRFSKREVHGIGSGLGNGEWVDEEEVGVLLEEE